MMKMKQKEKPLEERLKCEFALKAKINYFCTYDYKCIYRESKDYICNIYKISKILMEL